MDEPTRVLPDQLVEHARRFYAEGRTPVAPRRAATVVLLRDASAGLEAYLIRRVASMAFASGMHAFPGGGVDPRDASGEVGWAGPSPSEWTARLGLEDDAAARAMVCAAVRETFEESGVLLAGADPQTVVGDVSGAEWETARQALVARELAFSEFLAERSLVLRSDLLAAWSRWITPDFEPRRYDTCFFLAALPAAQGARHVGGEADGVAWVRPSDAVERGQRGELAMLPPTLVTLAELSGERSVTAALHAA
ncbi:MAG: NUDIX hydrolase, partial [Micromonosporaceae bacterium]|nr:NUDIX hydrolase [Micromonosporaceae bacterium]